MEIRELGLEQTEEIKRLMVDIFSKDPWNDIWTDTQLHAYVLELIDNRNSLSFGLYQGPALIGMALGRIRSWYEGTEYWIDEFGIASEMQCRGAGTKFLTELEYLLKGRGVKHIVLLTERSVPAYRFYLKNGFSEQQETVFFVKAIG